jgi:hypothetical protein
MVLISLDILKDFSDQKKNISHSTQNLKEFTCSSYIYIYIMYTYVTFFKEVLATIQELLLI